LALAEESPQYQQQLPAPRPGEVRITEERYGTTSYLRIAGEIDMATVPQLETAVGRARSHSQAVVIDLSEVTFIDSTGVSFILRMDAESRADGFSLLLVPGPPAVQRVFELVGIADRLPFRDI
jgi:anti-anti-sigma factor